MNRRELRPREVMQQLNADAPIEEQVRWLNDMYRNLYYQFQKYRAIVDQLADVVDVVKT